MWETDREFAEIYFSLSARHLISMPPERAYGLWTTARASNVIEGAVAELGVYKGGSAFLISKAVPNKPLHLFDTFMGLPTPSNVDQHKAGDFADTSIESVKSLLSSALIVIHAGTFPQSARDFSEGLALCHIDADLYSSTRDGLNHFWPLLNVGGNLVIDDYDWPHCPGVRQAVDEFCARNSLILETNVPYQGVLKKS